MEPPGNDPRQPRGISFEVERRTHDPGNTDSCPVVDLLLRRRAQPPQVVALEKRRDGPTVHLGAQTSPKIGRQLVAHEIVHLGKIERGHGRREVQRGSVRRVEIAGMGGPGPVGLLEPRPSQFFESLDEPPLVLDPLGQGQPIEPLRRKRWASS